MTEQQPHEAVDRPDGFELRCTWRGSYGANRSRRQIAMTAPVTQQEAGWEHPWLTRRRWDAVRPGGRAVAGLAVLSEYRSRAHRLEESITACSRPAGT